MLFCVDSRCDNSGGFYCSVAVLLFFCGGVGSCVLVFGCCAVKFGVLCCANLCGSWNLEGLVLLGVGAVKQGAILWTRGVRSVGEKKEAGFVFL